jgi:regulator of ribonuclease activity A
MAEAPGNWPNTPDFRLSLFVDGAFLKNGRKPLTAVRPHGAAAPPHAPARPPIVTKTADLYDRFPDEARVCEPLMRDFGGRIAFHGLIQTVKCFEDNTQVKTILGEPGVGRVLVVDGGGSLRCALLGDLIAAGAVANGWAGVILWGCVRDSAELATLDLGIKALAANPRKSERRGEGQRGGPVTFAGVRFAPGDWVYADCDGILVASRPLDLTD